MALVYAWLQKHHFGLEGKGHSEPSFKCHWSKSGLTDMLKGTAVLDRDKGHLTLWYTGIRSTSQLCSHSADCMYILLFSFLRHRFSLIGLNSYKCLEANLINVTAKRSSLIAHFGVEYFRGKKKGQRGGINFSAHMLKVLLPKVVANEKITMHVGFRFVCCCCF